MTITVSQEMWEHIASILSTCLTFFGMAMAVLLVSCCTQIGMPWFYRKLPVPVADDFEVRICKDLAHAQEDIAMEKIELYVV